jgi:predicted GNAT superfamily acetyltransferase
MDSQRIIRNRVVATSSLDRDSAYCAVVDWLWPDRIYSSVEQDPLRIFDQGSCRSMTAQSTADEFRTVTLTTPAQYGEAATLYREVFGYRDPDYGLNPRLLGALVGNGGSVVGVLDAAGRIVAFAYGFCGTDGRGFYHYSQSAVVAAEQQGRGLGRMLKQAQRGVALEHGMTHMRWTYDPIQTRNAHFNLDVLRARGRWFYPDLYGEPCTDRVVVEWDLRGSDQAVPPAEPDVGEAELTEADWGVPRGKGERRWLALPSDFASLAATRPDTADQVRRDVRSAFTDLLGKGLVAESCRQRPGGTAVYQFGPAPEPREPEPREPEARGPDARGPECGEPERGEPEPRREPEPREPDSEERDVRG